MKQLSSAEIRQMFLDFFKSKNHMVEPSSSLIPKDDPTLLWINSGVATLKKYFDGSVIPKNPRITNAQKSIRTNDIENVGKTARHHTFFEMLGNFSVGDYFKEDAIPWAWEFLTSPKWLDFDPAKLYVTVYPKDTEAARIWLEKVGLPEDHLFKVEDNFWDIGEGPSGPDSEIFYDRGQEFNNLSEDDEESYPGGENERYLEIWNIVFSEFNHLPDGTYVEQPHKNIDTGMGLERLVSVIQNAKTNFETDLFLPIIHATEELASGPKYGNDQTADVSYKIIADHARTVSFAIGDGALPSNEGRGYVLRRLLRRAALNGQKLGIKGAFLYKLVPVVGEIMKSYYPEVSEQADFIAKVIRLEEERFQETLADGLSLLNNLIEDAKASGQQVIAGRDAFKLFDTYGFPYELTFEYASDAGLAVDQAAFEQEMAAQRERARSARTKAQSMGSQDETLMALKDNSEFVYGTFEIDDAELLEIVVNDQVVDTTNADHAQLIFDKTPFYAEMGGQVADVGQILDESGEVVANVTDVQHAPNGQNLHYVDVILPLKKGARYQLKIDAEFRRKVQRNHTATHLLDQALRNTLGDHTHQAGSLVEPTYLRFDFTSLEPTTPAQLVAVEKMINEKIWAQIPVETTITDQETGRKMGAIALFGEKYGDEVRVVDIGGWSIEFCGGTHVANTGEIGLFKIVSEQAIGAGTRRIEAITSKEAFEYLNEHSNLLQQIKDEVKSTKVQDVPEKVNQLQVALKSSQKEAEQLQAEINRSKTGDIFDDVQEVNGLQVIAKQIEVTSMNDLRQFADDWKSQGKSDVLILAAAIDGKANMIISLNDQALTSGLKAGAMIKSVAATFGGGGGGRPNLAQAGGKNPAGLPAAITQAIKLIEEN
ncbi:alanyl-tRNA synthetase [Amylolactobacillus amylotrophicus DSM 20534]|uniref:Alanine--tRNA ligase n=3 Tax=Amylolactobacillus TaxID=2767876 RepID=A0A1L6XAQ5_9LACO|nr:MULTISPECIES: alanine--tRNA ligase [Amylolactobacillus]APT18065.1 alanine--tRNA ligase [Amylolactobacillus amylophilus DSM 20533 = JCM 1125]KRK37410.1 alanyl-tRNA synthetase [Amylolactobacillus amylotrophicus DSM 20534]KRM42083.1 alanyl-tRNA synthetase [Amylolactobacillus amylophilus DSM 20533 = JCM 1125]GED80576.1 alanine--tRNA ligase [Amylolactobacillus amylophilus]